MMFACSRLQGDLQEGDNAPNVPLLTLAGAHTRLLDQMAPGVPLVVLAGSIS